MRSIFAEHNLRQRILSALLAFCLLALPMLAAAASAETAQSGYVQVGCDLLNLRASANKEAALVASYERGSFLKLLDVSDDWCHVEGPDGHTGYMLREYLKLYSEMTDLTATVSTGGNILNLRDAADLNGAVLAQLNDGEQVQLIRAITGWFYVSYGDLKGYVVDTYLDYPGRETAAEIETQSRGIDPTQPMVALTFDDGPGSGTKAILEALDAVGGRATFFMVGNRVEEYAESARAVAAQGSEIGIHTWDHASLTKISEEEIANEIKMTVDVIHNITGVTPTLLRPPYGNVNDTVKKVCAENNMKIIQWNVDPEDWKCRNAKTVATRLGETMSDGCIVVCHDLYKETAEAMTRVIPALVKRGYQLVTVSEMLDARRNGGFAGDVYHSVS